jgi:hypothetical protein
MRSASRRLLSRYRSKFFGLWINQKILTLHGVRCNNSFISSGEANVIFFESTSLRNWLIWSLFDDSTQTSRYWPLLSVRKRFLVCLPGSDCLSDSHSSTVKIGWCSKYSYERLCCWKKEKRVGSKFFILG